MRTLAYLVAASAIALAGCSRSDASPSEAPPQTGAANSAEAATSASREPDVIYVPTPQPVVEEMLELANVQEGDVLYDLGSGDGRFPITAARLHGIRAVGIDIDPKLVAQARENAREAGVEHLVTFHEADLFESDISEASVVTLYLLETLNEKLRPKLLSELRPGSRIVSHSFTMGDWEPDEKAFLDGRNLYLWTVPAADTGGAQR